MRTFNYIPAVECYNYFIRSKYKMMYKGMYRGSGGAIYGLGFIGALIYFLSTATTFGVGVIGILKAIVWPAFLVYQAFQFLAR